MTKNNGDEMRQPVAKLGDIVHIRGYGNAEFEVFSVSSLNEINPLEWFEEITYDVARIVGKGVYAEQLLAYQEDITVVNTPNEVDYEQLEDHLIQRDMDINETLANLGLEGYEIFLTDEDAMDKMNAQYEENMKEAIDDIAKGIEETMGKVTPRLEAPQDDDERIDELLTELIDYQELVAEVGNDYEQGDGHYWNHVEDIKKELRRITDKIRGG